MRHFTEDELERMQDAQTAAMMDTCELRRLVETNRRDAYGIPVTEWVTRNTACGLDPRPKPEMNVPAGGGSMTQIPASDAMLRLPFDTEVSNVDRIRITHRFDVMLETPVDYVLGEIVRRGPSGLVVTLNLAEATNA